MTITASKFENGAKTNGRIFTSDRGDLSSNFESFGHIILDKLTNENSGAVILADAASGRQWTGAKLKDKILNVATALMDEYHFKQGTVVTISYDHSDLTCILALAIISAGGVVACAFPMDPYAELLYLARKVEPKFLFCHRKNFHWAKQLEIDLGYEVVAIAMDDQIDAIDSFKHFDHFINYDHKRSESLNQLPVACKDISRDVALITMSSGTTGKPKAIPVTHFNCFKTLNAFQSRIGKNIRFAFSASLDYVSGRLVLTGAIMTGYTAVVLNGFKQKSCLEAIQKYGINVIFLGAASFYDLITYEEIDSYDISSLRVIFPMGAKIIYLDEMREFLKRHPNIIEVKQGYGLSETSGIAMNNMTPEQYLQDCDNCGRLVPGVRAKIVDRATGELLGTNQQGIIHLQGDSVFPGYYDVQHMRSLKMNNHDDNLNNTKLPSPFIRDSTVFDEEGYYVTGDIAYFSDKEELYIVGREKELMSCRGAKKVLPQELEEILSEHPAVDSVCVLGIPDRIQLTLHCPRAFIVPKPNYYTEDFIELTKRLNLESHERSTQEVLEFKGEHKSSKLSTERRRELSKDLMEYLNERIGWEKQLTGGIVIIDEIPTLRSTGKLNKGYLRSLSVDEVEIYGDRSG